jgi:hypothetical protein
LLAGAAFGMAFLTRPSNLLLLIPILFSLRLNIKSMFFFFLGGLPVAAIFFAYNFVTNGSLLMTGYWASGTQNLMKTTGFTDRFNSYLHWINVTMSPLPLIGWLLVAADRKLEWRNRVMLISWFAAFFIFYSCYDIYGAWWYTRFLLPGYPAMILGALLVLRDVADRLGKRFSEINRPLLRWAVLLILVGVTLSYEGLYIKRQDLYNFGPNEIVHYSSCRWADRTIPNNSLVATMQMSGAMKFYTERPIIRWDWLEADRLPTVKKHAAEKGYKWYALLMPFEVEDAQKKMGGTWTKLGMHQNISLWRIESPAD